MGVTIALLTDFGLADSYVGIMKGVMRTICPKADFIDISHSISRQNIREAAFAFMSAYRYFPANTVFLVVVDPGVGSERRPIAVRSDEYLFVAPDNGVLSYVLADSGAIEAVELTNGQYHLEPVSQTFHGRDIFAPAAAYLAEGVALADFGAKVNDLQGLAIPELNIERDNLIGEVIYIDHFGNVVTSIGELVRAGANTLRLRPRFGEDDQAQYFTEDRFVTKIGDRVLRGVRRSYSEVDPGEPLMLIDSNGFLELAANQGHAAALLGLSVGDRIEIRI